ncbi:XdhC family protein [Streptomyces griseoincarnatus]
MLEIAADLVGPVRRGIEFVAATVTSVAGSAPRQPGSSLVVDADGTVLGDVSGGCVDAAVHDTCRDMLTGDRQARALRFGYSDADAFDGGLTCGGTIELLLRHHDTATEPWLAPALADAAGGRAVAVATIVRGPETHLGRAIVVRPVRHPGTIPGRGGRPPAQRLGGTPEHRGPHPPQRSVDRRTRIQQRKDSRCPVPQSDARPSASTAG